jgi:hypothetical protein
MTTKHPGTFLTWKRRIIVRRYHSGDVIEMRNLKLRSLVEFVSKKARANTISGILSNLDARH